ncbi:hypothetical protein RHSIM_Rhsim01G0020600 [Rhododendron simsii]|uniref:AAA+ ATPase domain-containing protein n=1 Tax=Rhododendron simsii TaxID=118357 RepID=A0A834LXA5_RHOSS|nr:hypothetical protein RHSIM_Rhsim01G0020600 [Rhododendron simsii]
MCFLGGIIELSVCKAFDEAVKAASKAGKYVLQYRTNLDKLRIEMRSLQYLKGTIERRVNGAMDSGEVIEDAVSSWQEDAGRMENEAQQLIGQVEARMHCFACSCPNIKWRYQLGKQAEEKTAAVNQLAAQGSRFDVVSHPKPPPPELEFPSAQNYVHFDSRTPIFDDIVGALKDPNVKMIGIYGLGGVGKTTLVEKVAKKVLDDGTFKQVPLVAVSKDLNVKEIQKKLADRLNFALDITKDEQGRANELWHKFKNGEKLYLVILDDIWEKVDLKAIGIPIADGTTGCKVVLTSRNKDLLRITMKADKNFSIAELSEAEAWDLFKKKVGNTIESRPEIDFLARQVCRKCKGLPVAINALGAALEEKPVHVWNDALKKLERYMITNIEGINQTVWASLKLSYDMLGSPEAKSCFLLCCLFLEDADISIDDLTRHCVANSLLSQNPYTLDEARNAVHTVVDALKSASLLSTVVDALKSAPLLSTDYHENVVKIHDVIRDVGISIAREEKSFLIDHGAHEWPRNNRNVTSYSAISLSFKSIKGLPNGLEYPQLHTLMVDNSELSDLEVPDNFFNGMIQLTVVSFTRMRMRRLPSSLSKLANLRMLYLNACELDDIAIIKELKSNLEVLSLRGSSIEALPLEIGQLTGLRVLDLQDCDKLKAIPRGVISKLISLEEMYFPENFDKWEAIIDKQEDTSNGENVNLEELRELLSTGRLTTLHIHILNVMLLSKEDLIFANLKGFKILLGSKIENFKKLISGRCMLELNGIQLRNEFIPLVDKADVVFLSDIKGLKKVLYDRGVGNRFPDLKYLKVTSCDHLEYLFGEPIQGLNHLSPFNNLTVLIIEYCKLKYLFSPTIARGFVHLEKLKVQSCRMMKAIVGFEGRNDEDEITSEVRFSKLKQLELVYLPNLISFDARKEKMGTTMGCSYACAQPLFSEKVIFPGLESLTIEKLDNIIKIWDKQSIAHVLEEQGSFCQLKSVDVQKCAKLMHVFPSDMHPQLKNLERLDVYWCKTMKGIAEFEGEIDQDGHRNEVIFPVLEKLSIRKVHKIIEIWDKQSIAVLEEQGSFYQLTDLDVFECKKLMHVFLSKMHSPLKNLKVLRVSDCPTMEGIVEFEGEGDEDGLRNEVCFGKLSYLELYGLPNLESFCTKLEKAGTTEGNSTIHALPLFNGKVIFPVLKKLSIRKVRKIIENWDKQSIAVLEEQGSFCQLTDLNVSDCEKLMHVFPSKMHSPLKNLKVLRVSDCLTMEGIVEFEGEIDEDGLKNEILHLKTKEEDDGHVEENWHEMDIAITVVLTVGAVALEIYAAIEIFSSNWIMLWLIKQGRGEWVIWLSQRFPWLFNREKKYWSQMMGQFDLLGYCLKHTEPDVQISPSRKLIRSVLGHNYEVKWDKSRHKTVYFVHPPVYNAILEYFHKPWIGSSISDSLIRELDQIWAIVGDPNKPGSFLFIIKRLHLATEICYRLEGEWDAGHHSGSDPTTLWMEDREASKALSDYMMYLLVMQTSLLPNVGPLFPLERDLNNPRRLAGDAGDMDGACHYLLSREEEYRMVAEHLKGKEKPKRWEIIKLICLCDLPPPMRPPDDLPPPMQQPGDRRPPRPPPFRSPGIQRPPRPLPGDLPPPMRPPDDLPPPMQQLGDRRPPRPPPFRPLGNRQPPRSPPMRPPGDRQLPMRCFSQDSQWMHENN